MTRNRVLVVKLSSLGDVIHVTPCLQAIRRAFPKAEIVMAVDSRFTPVVRNNPYVDKVIESPPPLSGPFRFLVGMFKELASLRDRPFDVAMDFQGNRRSAAWVYASRGKFKAGRGKRSPGWDVAVVPDLEKHAIVVCAEISRKIGISVDELKPEIFLSNHDDEGLLSILESYDLPKNEFILVNPFSRWHSKNWPPERYAELISKLWDDLGLPIIITGGPGEEDQAAELIHLMKPGTATPLAGKLTLGQAFCLTRRALLMITCDSGPMHAAAALGTKVVALFGPTLPERTGPWGDGHQVIQIARPPIHHTYLTDTDQTYMRAIDVQTVYRAVIASLGPLLNHPLGTRNSKGDKTKP